MLKKLTSVYDFFGTWKQSPFDKVLMQRDFFCIRCARVERFSISEEEFEAIKDEVDAGENLVIRKLLGAGWVYTSATFNERPREYVICPECVKADIVKMAQFQEVFAKTFGISYEDS